MPRLFEKHLQLLASEAIRPNLLRINRGIEKEGLRTSTDGRLAQTEHPKALGAALTHPHITTDYSEALLEFITPVRNSAEEVVEFLHDIHRYVHSQLDDEVIWAASMPCFLGGEDTIPIARYGSSNVGTLKHVYRIGLARRYGKMMQTIAGIHYNFSLPTDFWPAYQALKGDSGERQDFQTAEYFALIRNFKRYSWLILYLFGASPAMCSCFLQGRPHTLQEISAHTVYRPDATSLRMGDLGYNNSTQKQLNVSYNSLEQYVSSLGSAIGTPHPAYQAIGIEQNGEYQQLNSNILQIENEYYSDIRPKRVTSSGKKPLQVLSEQGVEYIEVRNLDINPFTRAGIDAAQIRFLDCFLLCCLLEDSPPIDSQESELLDDNKNTVVNRGRASDLQLRNGNGADQPLSETANQLFDKIEAVAEIMDRATSGNEHRQSVALQREKLTEPEATPSARIINNLIDNSRSYFEFSMERSVTFRDLYNASPLEEEKTRYFQRLAEESLVQQRDIEAADTIPFKQFLEEYLAQ